MLAEGYQVIGFDIEQHVYGEHRYPAQLVIQDVLTLHGSQFRNADLIVASPPCQEYSYMAMPWTKAKTKAEEYRSGKRDVKQLTALFDACFRIQREACEAAGRRIPLIVENVRGAIPWVGRSRWNFGSFHLWGDVPALMPITKREFKVGGTDISQVGFNVACVRKFSHGDPNMTMEEGRKNPGFRFDGSGRSFQNVEGRKFTLAKQGQANKRTRDPVASSHGAARKFASAMIAKIPLPLSRHIAAVYRP